MNTEMREFGMDQPLLDDMPELIPGEGSGNTEQPTSSGNEVYDRLRAELSKSADLEPITLPIPGRPGVALVLDVRIDMDTLQMWVKKATHRKNFRPRTMADIVLSNCCIGIKMGNEVVTDEDNEPYTLASPRIHEMLKVDPQHTQPTREAIRKLFASDGHIIGALGKIMEEAGYDEQDWEEEGDSPLSSS